MVRVIVPHYEFCGTHPLNTRGVVVIAYTISYTMICDGFQIRPQRYFIG